MGNIKMNLETKRAFYNENQTCYRSETRVNTHLPQKDDFLSVSLCKQKVNLRQELTTHDLSERIIFKTLLRTGLRINELLDIKLDVVNRVTR